MLHKPTLEIVTKELASTREYKLIAALQNEKCFRILSALSRDKALSSDAVAGILKTSLQTAINKVVELRELGLVERIGPRKSYENVSRLINYTLTFDPTYKKQQVHMKLNYQDLIHVLFDIVCEPGSFAIRYRMGEEYHDRVFYTKRTKKL